MSTQIYKYFPYLDREEMLSAALGLWVLITNDFEDPNVDNLCMLISDLERWHI